MAKPTPLPLGRANPHVNQSRGAESYIMNFYVTNYSTSFTKPDIEFNKGRKNDIPVFSGESVFKPRSAPENHRTGYIANVRPQIYYNRTLDELDNPQMGRMCEENYDTITQTHYLPYKTLTGLEELPVQVLGQKTSYTQNAYNHNPRESEVHSQFIDTKIRAPYDVLDKYQPILNREHDPIKNENFGHGPKYMSTEYLARFDTPKPNIPDKNHSSVGPKESSGFVDNKEKEDVLTAVPGERWLYNNRPTGNTVYKDKFPAYAYAKSETQLPNISNFPATKNSTYVKAYKPSDINPKTNEDPKTTEYHDNYLIRQKQPSLAERLGSAYVGPVNETGQTLMERGFTQTLDDPRRFITNYQIKHFDMNPKGKDREGYVFGGINGPIDDGYVKNVKLHNTGSLNTKADLYNLDPYQSRSRRAKDNFYDDHTHDHKFTLQKKTVTFQDNNPYSVKLTV